MFGHLPYELQLRILTLAWDEDDSFSGVEQRIITERWLKVIYAGGTLDPYTAYIVNGGGDCDYSDRFCGLFCCGEYRGRDETISDFKNGAKIIERERAFIEGKLEVATQAHAILGEEYDYCYLNQYNEYESAWDALTWLEDGEPIEDIINSLWR